MKIIVFLIGSITFFSCTKDWECCVETTTTHIEPSLIQLNGTTTHCIDFRGTNDEKDEFETDGTNTSSAGYGGTIDQVTECVID